MTISMATKGVLSLKQGFEVSGGATEVDVEVDDEEVLMVVDDTEVLVEVDDC